MAFKEKISWVTLAAMIVAYCVYFAMLARAAQAGPPPVTHMLALFAEITIVEVIVIAIVSILLAARARRDAEAPADERDRAIARRAASIAYYVLMIGMILVGVVMPFGAPGWQIVNAALAALVIAEASRYALVILSYRRGWHG